MACTARQGIVDLLVEETLKDFRLEDTRANRRKALEIIRDNWIEKGESPDDHDSYLVDILAEIERLKEEAREFGIKEDD